MAGPAASSHNPMEASVRRLLIPMCLLAVPLRAGEGPDWPSGRIGFGAFTERYSDGNGTRKGWSLAGEWFRDDKGPWSFSVLGTQRPEGKATQFTVAKEHAFGESSWVWIGLSGSTGADYLPSFRGDLDLNLGLSGPWGMGLEAAWNSFRDGSSVTLLQAGPSWMGETWSASARVQQLRYQPGSGSDMGFLADLRWGAHNLRRWHSLRFAWGQGILESQQPGGSVSSSSPGGTGGRGRRAGQTTANGLAAPSWQEQLLSSSSHLPITPRFALRVDLAWGQRESQFRMWSAGLQTLFTF